MAITAAELRLFAEAATGADLPQFVKDEFDAFLECGILAHAFCGWAQAHRTAAQVGIGATQFQHCSNGSSTRSQTGFHRSQFTACVPSSAMQVLGLEAHLQKARRTL